MSGMNGTGQPRFHVSILESAREDLRAITRLAIQVGQGKLIAAAVRQILTRLENDPREFGEPLYHHHSMEVTVYRGVVSPIYVDFGVHDEKPLVFFRHVFWLNPPG